MIHLSIPDPVQFILNRLKTEGHASYIVGGAVRDTLQKRRAEDFDILTQASLTQIQDIFSDQKVKQAGVSFPVCLVNGIEVSAPRSHRTEHWLEQDLEKRDLTINALAWDPETQNLYDPFDGKKDLDEKVIRFTCDPDKRIQEDPVRMVRACRFSAMIDAEIEEKSMDAIRSCSVLLEEKAAPERIQIELIKAMGVAKPSIFFENLRTTGLLKMIFPSLDRCFGLDGGPYHGETVYEHCLLVGDALKPDPPLLRLAGFLHDTGKFDAATFKDGRLTFAGHEKHFLAVKQDLERLRFSNKDMDYILSLLQAHMRPLNDKTTPRAARRLLAMLKTLNLSYPDFMRMRIADKKSNLKKRGYTLDELKIRLQKLYDELRPDIPLTAHHLALSGDDIVNVMGIDAGPEVGRIKAVLLEKVLDNPELNTTEALTKICLELKRPED